MSATPRIGYAPRGDGGHLGYDVIGEGPALITWPGGTVTTASLFDEPRCARAQRRLATFSTRITFDRRGMGYSDPLAPGQEPTLDLQCQDLLAVLDHVGAESATLLASGWDAQAMVQIAVEHPERVDKLILQAFSPCPMSRDDWPYGVQFQVVGAIQAELAEPGVGKGPHDILDFMAVSAADDAELLHWLEEAGRVSPSTANAYVAATLQMDIRPLLERVQVPTLILHSTRDPWTPVEGARFCAERIPDAKLVEFDSADHMFFTELMDERLDEVESFVAGTTRAHAQRRLRTVLFTDVVGSTERLSATQDVRWTADLDEIDSIVTREVHRFEGRLCKSMGDGHLALFERPSDGVEAARALVRMLSLMGIPIRAGLHIGEVELRGDDVAGVAVHIGARVAGKAQTGEILVTRTMADLLAGSPYVFESAGEYTLKGLPGSWPLLRVSDSRGGPGAVST